MNYPTNGGAIAPLANGQIDKPDRASALAPRLAANETARFWNILVPLVKYFHEVYRTDDGSIGIIGSTTSGSTRRDILCCDIKARTYYVDDLKPTRMAFRNLAEYGKLNARLQLMTFEVMQGVDVDFPYALKPKAYCTLRITAPDVFDDALLRDYIIGAVEFLRLRRHLVAPRKHLMPLLDSDPHLKIEEEWGRLLTDRTVAKRLRKERPLGSV